MISLIRMACVLCLLAHATGAAPVLAAVFPVQSRGIDTNSVRIVEDALADALLRTGELRLVERSQMQTVLREQGFQESGACDASGCVVEVGKLLGIRQGVVSSLGRLGGSWVLNARLIDIGSGEILVSTQHSFEGNLDRAMRDLVPRVAKDLTNKKRGSGGSRDADAEGSGGSSAVYWWTAGGLLVAGGTAAAALLLMDDGGSATTPEASLPDDSTVPFEVVLP